MAVQFDAAGEPDRYVDRSPALAALYYLVGALLARAERNWFVGVRTPWTLSDEAAWDRTHDRVAPLFKLAGVVALAAVVLPEFAPALLVAPTVAASLAGVAHSYVCYRRPNAA